MTEPITEPTEQEWLDALLSGDYKQGRRRLRHAGRYCCLGVLCEIDPRIERAGAGYLDPRDPDPYETVPPARLRPSWMRFGDVNRLTSMNDHDHASFEDIAHWWTNVRPNEVTG